MTVQEMIDKAFNSLVEAGYKVVDIAEVGGKEYYGKD
jgi:predicted GNAT superfamily acetyltransferase